MDIDLGTAVGVGIYLGILGWMALIHIGPLR